jgi:hypothetical protein
MPLRYPAELIGAGGDSEKRSGGCSPAGRSASYGPGLVGASMGRGPPTKSPCRKGRGRDGCNCAVERMTVLLLADAVCLVAAQFEAILCGSVPR